MATEIIKSFEIYVYNKRINTITDNIIDTFHDHMKSDTRYGYEKLSKCPKNSILKQKNISLGHDFYTIKADTFEDALTAMRNFLEKDEK